MQTTICPETIGAFTKTVQAALLQALHDALPVDPDIRQIGQSNDIILPGLTGKSRVDHFQFDGEAAIAITADDDRWDVTLYRCRSASYRWQRPGTWWGSEKRTDQHGHKWDRSIRMVQDDFGQLVEVAQ